VLGAPSGASAQGGAVLDGSPLNIFADGLGAIQVRQDGVVAGLFYDPDENPGHAGLEIKEGDSYYPLEDGFTNAPDRVSQGVTVTPQADGSQLMQSIYTVGPHLRVTENISYTNGASFLTIRYHIENLTLAPVSLRAGALADLYVGNNDSGNGAFSNVAPRFVGGSDPASGLVYGLQELTPWRTFQEGDFESVFENFSATGLSNMVDPGAPDNGVGVDFALDLGPSAAQDIDVRWLLAAPAPPGTFTPTPTPITNEPDENGIIHAPTLAQLPPPPKGKVNIGVRKGKILVKIPPSKKYVELKEALQVPAALGMTVDSRKGRLNIVGPDRKLAWFYSGIFKIGQTKGSKPITDLTLAEPLAKCPKSSKSAVAAAKKKKTRKLWGEGKGRYRTTGRFSSATVRGTKWLVTDTCAGTQTKVTQGVVLVRDFVRRKNVFVRAGQKPYLARKRK